MTCDTRVCYRALLAILIQVLSMWLPSGGAVGVVEDPAAKELCNDIEAVRAIFELREELVLQPNSCRSGHAKQNTSELV